MKRVEIETQTIVSKVTNEAFEMRRDIFFFLLAVVLFFIIMTVKGKI